MLAAFNLVGNNNGVVVFLMLQSTLFSRCLCQGM